MSMLKDLYNGFLKPWENFGHNDFKGYKVLSESAHQREQKLLNTLSEEQTHEFKRFCNDHIDMNNLELQRMFVYAFRMGAEFALDLFPERNNGLP